MTSAVGHRAQLLARRAGEPRTAPPLSLPRLSQELLLRRIRLIARTLEEEPGLTSPELAERVGYGRRATSLLLLRLEERGQVTHDGRRWFAGPGAAFAQRVTALRRSARDPASSRNSR